MERTIRIEHCLPYTKEQVWHALTDPAALGKWFMKNNLELVLDHEFTFNKDPQPGWNGITYCRVIAIEPLQHIAYTYSGTAGAEKTLACAGINSDIADRSVKGIFTELYTVLSFTLSSRGKDTCLLLEHSGFKGLKQVIVSFVMGMGWKKLLKKLAAELEKGTL